MTVFQLDHQLSHARLGMDESINFKLIKLGHAFCNVMLPDTNCHSYRFQGLKFQPIFPNVYDDNILDSLFGNRRIMWHKL